MQITEEYPCNHMPSHTWKSQATFGYMCARGEGASAIGIGERGTHVPVTCNLYPHMKT